MRKTKSSPQMAVWMKMPAQEEVQAFGKEQYKKQFRGVRSEAKTSMLNYI